MDLAGIAAILALAGIPVSVLLGRWQIRTALAQARENHRTAMEVAEANHRSALELARRGLAVERDRWLLEARRAEYRYFQNALGQLRRVLATQATTQAELRAAYEDVHDSSHRVAEVGPDEVHDIANVIRDHCYTIPTSWPASVAQRMDLWTETVAPLRAELDAAIRASVGNPTPLPQRDSLHLPRS
ncbi:hypothetical protein ACIRRT_38985 [Streptomyces sp. NPDC102256]|uniref:hypothetical protein n=1 Tax=Streptomyces sp. NPDC102256 TaxID=3366147 RepID=UPI0038018378